LIKLLALPSTFTGEEKSLLLRTYKIGMIARAAATFGITDIGIYYDPDPLFESHGLGRFIVKVLKYINTPPYLRKIAFGKDDSLRYVGYTEPLKTPHHLDREYKVQYRYAYVLERVGNKLRVNDGREVLWVKIGEGFKEGNRIVVIDTERRVTIDRRKLPIYFGYYVFYYNKGLLELLKSLKKRGFFIIGTSRYGEDIRKTELKLCDKEKIAIFFGSPFRGLREMLGGDVSLFDVFLNFIPEQNVKTIRTEEAVFYTLSILRYLNII